MLAPTGSGKTLAAFLYCIDRLVTEPVPEDAPRGVRALYISPLKALAYDIERNLRAPLAGIQAAAAELGLETQAPRIDVRTGDTPARDRARQKRRPGELLVTTPESLYLILSSQARETLRTVRWVILDEIHVLAASKRGVHLALSLERLTRLVCEAGGADPQRIGLSATQRPLDEVARYLGGDRSVAVVDASAPPNIELSLEVPVRDMECTSRREEREDDPGGLDPTRRDPTRPDPTRRGIWDAIHPRLLELIQSHTSTLVFVNSRLLCERLARRLNELDREGAAARGEVHDGRELVLAHHGSLAHAQRAVVEEALKAGEVRGLVATSSLELGIDMGAIDLVLQVESPGAVHRGLQRVGRAGHSVGEVSEAKIFPKFKGDLLEAVVVSREMLAGRIEALSVPRRCLDVLAQHIASMVCQEPWERSELEALIRRTYSYRDLSSEALTSVLDMLSGRYPSDAFADLRPLLVWDRERDRLEPRRGTRGRVVLNPGTIPDRGLYAVHLGVGGPRIGELDEEMVFESRRGETFILGASTWRVTEITRDRVIVEPAPGEPGKLPFWHGAGPGRPVELGAAVGRFLRELSAQPRAQAEGWLRETAPICANSAENLANYVFDQLDATGTVPSDRALVIERFRDELGDWRVCILSPFGRRVHGPWAMAVEAALARESGVSLATVWSDDGIALRVADADGVIDLAGLLPKPEEVEDLVVEQLSHSALFAGTFRECAARALLLPRRGYRQRRPLWAQRIKAETLLAAASRFADFPIVLETYRECLKDVFDLPALKELLGAIQRHEVEVIEVETERPSPFARSLTFSYVAAFMYEQDAPIAERRAQALTLDRDLLRDLLGQEALRELLDASVLAELEAELQCLVPNRHARHPDGLSDLLRRLGDLSLAELGARSTADPSEWLAELGAAKRVVAVAIAGAERWVAVEDAARYRDALGCVLPSGIPEVFLEPVSEPLSSLLLRYARTRGPFGEAEPAARFGLDGAQVRAELVGLVERGHLVRGAMRPGGTQEELCDPDVLRQLRRRTLSKLRRQVAPVEGAVLARFLARWHQISRPAPGEGPPPDETPEGETPAGETPEGEGALLLEAGVSRSLRLLRDAITRLEGVALPLSELESRILPARVPGYRPELLDALGQQGEIVWVGAGGLGPRDGRIALYRRERVGLLRAGQSPPPPPSEGLATTILAHLESSGASFSASLLRLEGASSKALTAALLELAWAGWITNDSLGPLRAARNVPRGRNRRPTLSVSGGRWSLSSELLASSEEEPRDASAWSEALLERYGILSRGALASEGLAGGFEPLYRELRREEELGRVRRGHFVDGLRGAQFALPAAVDRLRAARDASGPEPVVLAATDPANPYGSLLPWPEVKAAASRPRRATGVAVALAGGLPVLLLESKGRSLTRFPAAQDTSLFEAALAALVADWRSKTRQDLHLERIDGEPARGVEGCEAFLAHGFRNDHRGLTLPSR